VRGGGVHRGPGRPAPGHPAASPTLPLAASLGLTFSYNVTMAIPIYIEVAKVVQRTFPDA
jgi:hypothetical protein